MPTLSRIESEDDLDEFEYHHDAFGAEFDKELETRRDDELRVRGHHLRRGQIKIRLDDREDHLEIVRRQLDQRRYTTANERVFGYSVDDVSNVNVYNEFRFLKTNLVGGVYSAMVLEILPHFQILLRRVIRNCIVYRPDSSPSIFILIL